MPHRVLPAPELWGRRTVVDYQNSGVVVLAAPSAASPLPLVAVDSLAAVYMEGVFEPGMHSMVHRHPGTEAFYTLEGSMCLETPEGKLEQHAGDPGVLVCGGVPMMLTGTGTEPRRSVVLILQDATKPRSTPASDWTPRNLCRG